MLIVKDLLWIINPMIIGHWIYSAKQISDFFITIYIPKYPQADTPERRKSPLRFRGGSLLPFHFLI